jgi:predicted dehydrogenase
MNNYSRRRFLHQLGGGIGTAAFAPAFPQLLQAGTTAEGLYTGKKLNIALCGLGKYAGILADGLMASTYCRLAGIVTGTPEKALAWQKKYRIASQNTYDYNNFDSIANNPNIDLVYVVLPNSMHKDFTIRAARAGKHVITEKPMALNARGCESMIKACEDARVQLAVGYRLHYEPYNMEMKRLGQQKVFGTVRLMETSLGYKVDDNKEWRLHKALSGGGPLMNLGVYCIPVCYHRGDTVNHRGDTFCLLRKRKVSPLYSLHAVFTAARYKKHGAS